MNQTRIIFDLLLRLKVADCGPLCAASQPDLQHREKTWNFRSIVWGGKKKMHQHIWKCRAAANYCVLVNKSLLAWRPPPFILRPVCTNIYFFRSAGPHCTDSSLTEGAWYYDTWRCWDLMIKLKWLVNRVADKQKTTCLSFAAFLHYYFIGRFVVCQTKKAICIQMQASVIFYAICRKN